ncbi:M20 family metallopeptidase [Rhizobium sp. SYY.PMSO]|uniref:M20 family metallopeptidase n=1 Tax=Rhizobium sp. SYY.PMSO TaxID=3382192 RepID=UPI00398F8FFB
MHKRVEEAVADVWSRLDAGPDRAVGLTSDLVRIPSVNPKFQVEPEEGLERQVQELIAGELSGCGLDIRTFDALPGRPNLLAETEASGSPERGLILCGHIDVVPVGDRREWSYDPFCGDIREGKVLGRGTMDMKAGMACCVEALRVIREAGIRLQGKVALHSVVDEEAGGFGAKAMVRAGHLAPAAIIAEPGGDEIFISQGGLEWLRVTIRGRQGHSAYRFTGMYPQPYQENRKAPPISAADMATRFLSALRDYEAANARVKSHPMMPPGINHFGVGAVRIGAGLGADGLPMIMTNPGIVPDVAVIDIDHKFMPHETSADIRADFERFVAHFCATDPWLRENPIEVKWDLYDLHFPPMNTSADHPLVRIVTDRRASLGKPTALRGSIGVTDGAHYAVAGVHPIRYGPFGANQHAADEWADVESIKTTTKVLAAAILDWCGVA